MSRVVVRFDDWVPGFGVRVVSGVGKFTFTQGCWDLWQSFAQNMGIWVGLWNLHELAQHEPTTQTIGGVCKLQVLNENPGGGSQSLVMEDVRATEKVPPCCQVLGFKSRVCRQNLDLMLESAAV